MYETLMWMECQTRLTVSREVPILCARNVHKHIGFRERWFYCFVSCISGPGICAKHYVQPA